MMPERPTQHEPRPTPAGATPTRRALLGLLGAPFVASPTAATASLDEAHLRLWLSLDVALRQRDQALARRDRLEAALVRQIGHPRVRLPTGPGKPARYAADLSSIDRALGPDRRHLRRQFAAQLQQHQRAWDRAAEACGLTQALADEDAAFMTVEQATAALLRTPAISFADIRLKLAVLVATHAPGPALHDASPWRELHQLLADLDQLGCSAADAQGRPP